MATIIKRSQNTLACVYTTSQFLSNATVKRGSNNIILELAVSSTRIITNFELLNTLACVYTMSQFLSNATVKSRSNKIILELAVSSTRIRIDFELFLEGTTGKILKLT